MPVKMIASRLHYSKEDRKEYPAGASFVVPDDDAADRLERRRRATRAPLTVKPAPVDVPTQTYVSRVMTPAPAVETPSPTPEVETPTKRPYRRRDMVAEQD